MKKGLEILFWKLLNLKKLLLKRKEKKGRFIGLI